MKKIYWGFSVIILLMGGFILYILLDNSNFEKSMQEYAAFSKETRVKEENIEPEKMKRRDILSSRNTFSGNRDVSLPKVEPPDLEINSRVKINIDPPTPSVFPHDHDPEHEHSHVMVSPFGFGKYPRTPADFPFAVSWRDAQGVLSKEILYQAELVDRVLIKLHKEGDKEVLGAVWHKGKVYPMYPNTFYVEQTDKGIYKEIIEIDGKEREVSHAVSAARIIGPGSSKLHLEIDKALTLDKPLPTGVKVLELDTHGIDPYEFLGIK